MLSSISLGLLVTAGLAKDASANDILVAIEGRDWPRVEALAKKSPRSLLEALPDGRAALHLLAVHAPVETFAYAYTASQDHFILAKNRVDLTMAALFLKRTESELLWLADRRALHDLWGGPGPSAMHYLSNRGMRKVIKTLWESGHLRGGGDEHGRTAAWDACDPETLDLVLETCGVNARDNDGRSVIFTLAESETLTHEWMDVLQKHNLDINQAGGDGRRVLEYVMKSFRPMKARESTLALLRSYGAK